MRSLIQDAWHLGGASGLSTFPDSKWRLGRASGQDIVLVLVQGVILEETKTHKLANQVNVFDMTDLWPVHPTAYAILPQVYDDTNTSSG